MLLVTNDEEPDEIVYEDDEGRTVEWQPEGANYPRWVKKLGHWFRLRRSEVVSRSGERTHNRVTYKSEEPRSSDDVIEE